MESSQSLQNDIEYLVDLEDSKSIFSTEDLLFISRRLWGQSKSWGAPGVPEITSDCYDEALDILAAKRGIHSVLHSCIMNKSSEVTSLITAGAKLHLISKSAYPNRYRVPKDRNTPDFLKNWDTPTSFAMYTSNDCCFWRDAVVRAGLDLEEFINEELEQNLDSERENPLLAAGWSNANLAMLLARDINPSECIKSCNCNCNCFRSGGDFKRTLKQPKWLRFLSLIKTFGTKSEIIFLEESQRVAKAT
jgi:hypothetical protein